MVGVANRVFAQHQQAFRAGISFTVLRARRYFRFTSARLEDRAALADHRALRLPAQ